MTFPRCRKDASFPLPKSSPRHKILFGNLAPFAEPATINSLTSPHYDATHYRLRAAIRQHIDAHILPYQLQWEALGGAPRGEAHAWLQAGFAHADVPKAYRPDQFQKVAGTDVCDLDAFHTLIMTDETSRVEGGVMISLGGASVIGVPPIINHGTEEQKRMWLPGLFNGTTNFCLGITEPTGGSDVGNIRTSARKASDGRSYVVNGNKKWITGAPWATHMTTAVRTGGGGFAGISLLVIPLKSIGVTIRRIENSGQSAGGASWVTLENVQVPVENLLGAEGAGFLMIMTNFNKERYVMAVGCNRKARTCLSTAWSYAHDRETFGKPLISNQIIRHKLTTIARKVESHWAWLEQLAYHITHCGWQSPDIAGRIALAKIEGGQLLELAAREAQQIMGGVAYQKGGVGGVVEQITRDLRMMVVGGGSEEILADLAFREEEKRAKKLGAKL